MNVLHLLTLLATVMAHAAECFVMPAHSKHFAPEATANNSPRMRNADDEWLTGGSSSDADVTDNFPLQETGGPYEHNDRSVYDPGVGGNIPLSAFLEDAVAALPADTSAEATVELLSQLHAHIKEDEDTAAKAALLLRLLESSATGEPMPLVYVEDEPDEAPEPVELSATAAKRSGRYYRRYPWKRQNTRYESEQRYLCVPSRNDVLKLLVGLDEGRKGNHGRTVNFCNRKRPAKAIFSNIRFLG